MEFKKISYDTVVYCFLTLNTGNALKCCVRYTE